jgi:hypothetical protein
VTETCVAHSAGGREASGARLAELVALSASGHDDAFAELYDLTAARIHGVVLRVLRSADHAAEVTQEVSSTSGGRPPDIHRRRAACWPG